MARGGARSGAGRPRGDRSPDAIGYRARARDIVRADQRGMTLAQLIDEALDATAAAEERRPDDLPVVTIVRALAKL